MRTTECMSLNDRINHEGGGGEGGWVSCSAQWEADTRLTEAAAQKTGEIFSNKYKNNFLQKKSFLNYKKIDIL